MSAKNHRFRGFSLLELMIVVAIIGLSAGIAIPSYNEYTARTARSEAWSQLEQGRQYMERVFNEHGSYKTYRSGAGVALPTGLNQSPQSGTARYTIAIESATLTVNTYTLIATRSGAMTSDKCGNLRLDHAGTPSLISPQTGITLKSCGRSGP